jgi:hypothetical protein
MRIIIISFVLLLSFSLSARDEEKSKLALTPPMGWNSFSSYGVYLHDKAARANIDTFIKKLKPAGYEYFVIDLGWYGEYKLKNGTMFPAEKHASKVKINKYGLLQPSDTYFPKGLQHLIDRCHQNGIKFGLHLMRGIPREAVRRNTPIKGTNYFACDIVDTTSICEWNYQNYGIDMSKPGAQEFYNSLINQMAAWGVDFIKYDDIVPYPKEVEAVTNAITQAKRPMVLSLSPGDKVHDEAISTYNKANMLRVTSDVWDTQHDIDVCFNAWRKWQGKETPGFWIDMDMIPFGQLQLMSPKPAELTGKESRNELLEQKKKGKLTNIELLAGVGWNRLSELSKDQMYTFITMRALAASPLIMGGDLPTLDHFSLRLITNKEMIACNQNGIMGKLVYDQDGIEIWNTHERNTKNGWIGIFNRTNELKTASFSLNDLGLYDTSNYNFYDVWNSKQFLCTKNVISANGVVFIRYEFNKLILR